MKIAQTALFAGCIAVAFAGSAVAASEAGLPTAYEPHGMLESFRSDDLRLVGIADHAVIDHDRPAFAEIDGRKLACFGALLPVSQQIRGVANVLLDIVACYDEEPSSLDAAAPYFGNFPSSEGGRWRILANDETRRGKEFRLGKAFRTDIELGAMMILDVEGSERTCFEVLKFGQEDGKIACYQRRMDGYDWHEAVPVK